MFINLYPAAIGIQATFDQAIELARGFGYQAVELDMREISALVDKTSLENVKSIFGESGIRAGGWSLPVDWRGEQASFQADLARLPMLASIGEELDCPWVPTFVMPFSNERPFAENFNFHLNRFKAVAEILKDHGCRLGLEFLGPKTLRDGYKYEFIHTMAGMLELAAAIGTGNVGLLLDAWHWYTSHGTIDELKALRKEDVVYVHVNDAPLGLAIDEQQDGQRDLPGATGVIDIVSFLKILDGIGFDGPVTPEPFSRKLVGLEPAEKAQMVMDALGPVWKAAGLA